MMRNLLGLRSLGIAISLFSAIAVTAGLLLPTTSADLVGLTLVVCAAVCLVLARFVTKAAVKRTGEAYAIALLRTCQTVAGKEVGTLDAEGSFFECRSWRLHYSRSSVRAADDDRHQHVPRL